MCPRLEGAVGDHRPRRRQRRSRQGRADPPLPGCRRQAAGRTRPRHLAGQAHGLRQFRVFSRCSTANRRNADRSTTRSSRCAANLDQITTSLERLRSGGLGGADRDNQRRSVLTALAQNNCGPQYANAARGPGSFLDNLFGNNSNNPASAGAAISARNPAPSAPSASAPATAPIFRSRSPPCPARFPDDEKTCKALCPAAEATLFAYRNPGEDMNQAVSISGQPYSSLAERISLPSGIQSVLRLQGRRTDLVRRAEERRRQSRRRTTGRHHRHRGEREEDGSARTGRQGCAAGKREEGCRQHAPRTLPAVAPAAEPIACRTPMQPRRLQRQTDPDGRSDLHPGRKLISSLERFRRPPAAARRQQPVVRLRAAACRHREIGW